MTIKVDVPASASTNAQSRTPAYISPSTLGATITVWGVLQTQPSTPTAVVSLSSGASSSTVTCGTGSPRTCTLTIQAPVGNDNFLINTYDAAPVSGAIPGTAHLLSTATVMQVVVSGVTNTLPVTLNGVPATIVLGPPGFLVPTGTSSTFSFTVNAQDADGNYIIGPGTYSTAAGVAAPITLAVTGDSNHTITLATSTITSPATTAATNTVSATYNGGTISGANGIATITGTATGATSGSLTVQSSSSVTTVTVVVPAPVTTASQTQAVLPQGGYWTLPNGVAGYSGSIQYATNSASSTGSTTIALTSSTTAPGTLPGTQPMGTPLLYLSYSLNNSITFTQSLQSLSVTLPSSITTTGQNYYETVYDLTAGTNVTSSYTNTTFAGTGGQTIGFGPGAIQNPTQVTFPQNEQYEIVISSAATASPQMIYVANTSGNSVTVFPLSANGNVAPAATITGSNTGLNGPFNVAADASGKIYVLNSFGNSITVYPANPSGTLNETPLATITGSNTGLSGAYGIAVDASGKIYVGSGANVIEVFAANPGGTLNEAPVATITGSSTGLNSPTTVAVDASGKIYVANQGGNSVTVYAAGASGNVSPIATIAGSNTGLNSSSGIALDASGKIYAANYPNNNVTVYAANPSGTLNETPLATISGSNTGLGGPQGIALDASGNIYVSNTGSNNNVVEVFAANPSGALNETPLATISGTNTGTNTPRGIAVH